MHKVVLIIPYFGKLPDYMNFFLKSLEGKKFDVLFVSDLQIAKHPSNFRILGMSLAQLAELAERRLQTKVTLNAPIRLCDFKPMYGQIFREYIADYDYWAFGDCDVVYGASMNDFIDKVVEEKWDAVSCRKCWSSGSFFMMRNSEKMCRFFERCINWKEIAALPQNAFVNFDEIGSQRYYVALQKGAISIAEACKDRDCLAAALWRSDDIRFFHEDIACEENLSDCTVRMDTNGALACAGKAVPYFHFIQAKWMRYFRTFSVPYDEVGEYLIDDTGFYLTSMLQTRRLRRISRKICAGLKSLRRKVFPDA